MIEFSRSVELNVSPEFAFRWHTRPAALERLLPPWLPVRLMGHEGLRDGARATLRIGRGPFAVDYVAVHRNVTQDRCFEDVQHRGPFRAWHHTHEFIDSHTGCRLHDQLRIELPAGLSRLSWVAARVHQELERQFAYRHRVLAAEIGHAIGRSDRMLTIAITGSGGLIGTALRVFLEAAGHTVLRVVRAHGGTTTEAWWDPSTGAVSNRISGVDAVVHLAGETLFAPRWTSEKKRRIYESRVDATRGLVRSILELRDPPPTFIGASAVGVYGSRADETLTESSGADSTSFLARVCVDWEDATRPLSDAGIRVVNARFGIVLTPAGGALQKMLPAFRLGLGGVLGDGNAYVSWILPDDLVMALYHVIQEPAVTGPVNVTAPNPTRWKEFSDILGRVLRRPAPFRVPTRVIRLAAGELGEDMLLSSARAIPAALQRTGFRFAYPDLEAALRHILGRVENAEHRCRTT